MLVRLNNGTHDIISYSMLSVDCCTRGEVIEVNNQIEENLSLEAVMIGIPMSYDIFNIK